MKVRVQVSFGNYQYGDEFVIADDDPEWEPYLEREWVKPLEERRAVKPEPDQWRPDKPVKATKKAAKRRGRKAI